MFERMTDRAKHVIVMAQEEARQLNHNYIGTEHLLMGLLHEGEGIGYLALTQLGLNAEIIRNAIVAASGIGKASIPGHIPFTPRAKKVLELSLREALQLGHNHIGTEHLLLGIVREGEGAAIHALDTLGIKPKKVRDRVIGILGGPSEIWMKNVASVEMYQVRCSYCGSDITEVFPSREAAVANANGVKDAILTTQGDVACASCQNRPLSDFAS